VIDIDGVIDGEAPNDKDEVGDRDGLVLGVFEEVHEDVIDIDGVIDGEAPNDKDEVGDRDGLVLGVFEEVHEDVGVVCMQKEAPEDEYEPGLQGIHEDARTDEYVPAVQLKQVVVPLAGLE
jgi:hypothetical protein